jgi:hypothetical protein
VPKICSFLEPEEQVGCYWKARQSDKNQVEERQELNRANKGNSRRYYHAAIRPLRSGGRHWPTCAMSHAKEIVGRLAGSRPKPTQEEADGEQGSWPKISSDKIGITSDSQVLRVLEAWIR